MDIFLHKDMIQNKYANYSFSDFDFLVYTGLRCIAGSNTKKIYYISLNQIIIELFGSLSISRRLRTEIKKSLLNISGYDDDDLIKIVGKLDEVNNEFIMDLSNLYVDTNKGNFITVDDEDIKKVLSIRFNGYKETLFRYYCVVLSTVNNANKVFTGCLPLKSIRDMIDSINTEATQLKYNKLLENAMLRFPSLTYDIKPKSPVFL